MYRNYPELIQSLALRVADLLVMKNEQPSRVEMREMADGSGCWFALVETTAGHEYRITAPAPTDAPAWTRGRDGYEVTKLHGDDWLPVGTAFIPGEVL
jgi:hypothetical protein